jgi:hypothetical protein
MWPPLPADNEEGWQRLRDVAPFFSPTEETVGAGLSEENPGHLIAYKYPMITSYADTSDEEAYNLVMAMANTFEMYKDVNAVMPRWQPDRSGQPPADAPFHPGAIEALTELGLWTEEHQAWNDRRLERMQKVQDAWAAAEEAALEQEIPDKEWPDFWAEWRQEHLQ